MTKLLDLLQEYVKWRTLPDGRKLHFRRIDGATPLEEREDAIRDFNRPGRSIGGGVRHGGEVVFCS